MDPDGVEDLYKEARVPIPAPSAALPPNSVAPAVPESGVAPVRWPQAHGRVRAGVRAPSSLCG